MPPLLRATPTLGILTCERPGVQPPFAGAAVFAQLALIGHFYKIRVVIFQPTTIDWERRTIRSWSYDAVKKTWCQGREPLPWLCYDRCHYRNREHLQRYRASVQRMRQDPMIRFLGKPLAGKWQTYQLLQLDEQTLPFLPPTHLCQTAGEVEEILEDRDSLLIKPNLGSQGRGVAVIKTLPHGKFRVYGRTFTNQCFEHDLLDRKKLRQWLGERLRRTPHVSQPFLDLQTKNGSPFDVRLLVQKDADWNFRTMGAVVRIGRPHTLTANLHGGGQVQPLRSFLEENYAAELQEVIIEKLKALGRIIPVVLEANHGQLIELGIDVGIERDGSTWLLEVNSKPGRSIFRHLGDKQARNQSLHLTIRYAASLLTKTHGGA